jgi:hypothetical protein
LEKLDYFLRDHNTQDVSNYDPKEFDVLHAMMSRLGRVNGLIDVVCGYRTPETNAALRQNSPWTGVAEHSNIWKDMRSTCGCRVSRRRRYGMRRFRCVRAGLGTIR